MWFDTAIPFPPCTSIATLDACHEHSEARNLEMFAYSPSVFSSDPESSNSAAFHFIASAATSLAYASAIGNWTPWLAPSGFPKTTLFFAYSTLFLRNQRASPIHSEARRTRSGLRTQRSDRNPIPSSPISYHAGS